MTPCLVITFANLNSVDKIKLDYEVWKAVFFDVVMIFSGFLSSITPRGTPFQICCTIISFVAFIPTMIYAWSFFRRSQLNFLPKLTTVIWAGFPTIWTLSILNIFSIEMENVSYCILDILAKCFYSQMLLNGNSIFIVSGISLLD
jgi:bacteriorhodopsin